MSVTDVGSPAESSTLSYDPPSERLPEVRGYREHWSRPRPRRISVAWRMALRNAFVGFVLLTSVLLALLLGTAAALVPAIVVLCAWAMLALPLHIVAPVSVGLLLAASNPAVNPAENEWKSPLLPIGEALYTIMPIKIALSDVLIGVLVARAVATLVLDGWGPAADRRPPRQFVQAVLAAVGVLGLWTFYGLATGGDFKNMLWQVRPLLWLPGVAIAIAVAASDRRTISRLRTAILMAGVVKAAEGVWFYYMVAKPKNLDVAYVTTHSDSVLWSLAVSIVLAEWIELRTRASRRNVMLLLPIYAIAIVLNNRRTVWVSVFASIFFIAVVAQRPVKRQLARLLGVTWPLIAMYVVVGLGTHSQSIVFKPVAMIDSVMFQTDDSSSTRDIENYNLIVTLKARPLLGWGFGHEYIEASVANDISRLFEQYRYIPHNSFLGLWAFLGPIGAGGYFLLPVVGIYYAVATRKRSGDLAIRAAGSWAVCSVIAYLVQGWADIGLQDFTAIVCVGIGLGIAGALPRHVADEPDSPLASLG